MSRSIRTFSTLGRSVIKPTSSISRESGAIRVRHVRVLKPWFTVRRAKQITLCLALAGFTWHRLEQIEIEEEGEEDDKVKAEQITEVVHQVKVTSEVGKVGAEGGETATIDQGETEVVEETDEDGLVPEEQPEDAWFIPLGIARQLPQTFYRGDDPEWQDFLEFARDRKRGHFVRNELAGAVGHYVGTLKNFQKFLGIPITTGRYWLDFDFPDGPPPEYERAGIEITEDYVAYTVRPVEALNVSRLHRALWPMATGTSLWDSCNAYWILQTAKLRKMLNMEEDKSSKQKNLPSGYTDFARVLGDEGPKDVQDSKGTQGVSGLQGAQQKPPDLVASTTASPSDGLSPDRPWILKPLPSVPKPNSDLVKASTVFRHSLARNWQHASAPPPRGTFLVSGLVELSGPKGICCLDVRAAYDPRESQWVAIGIAVRRLQKRKQKPKG